MRIIIGCERSGVIREAFRARGHAAWSCDIEPSEDGSRYHIQGDVLDELYAGWDLAILHPPCRFLCSSGIHWNKQRPERAAKTEAAMRFFLDMVTATTCISRVCIENSIGIMSTHYRKPDQIIQPNQFGEDASKATCLWLKGLPLLASTDSVEPRMVDGKPRWANQTDSGQNRLAPSAMRSMDRARTYPGIAKAMAQQWG